jgi:hypothetical protein
MMLCIADRGSGSLIYTFDGVEATPGDEFLSRVALIENLS